MLFSFGFGNITGSILGGRLSDFVLARLKTRNGGVSVPEVRLVTCLLPYQFLGSALTPTLPQMRLKAMFPAMPFMVASFLTFAWTSEEKVSGKTVDDASIGDHSRSRSARVHRPTLPVRLSASSPADSQ